MTLGRLEADDDVSELGPREVAVKMLFAPINPSDINQVEGSYGVLPTLPAVGGNEGVGEVTAVGPHSKHLSSSIADSRRSPVPIACLRLGPTPQSMLQKCPSDIPAEYAATIGVNPCTAYRLLRDFETLREGDTIIQNGANSQVG
ncbi:unnamed protein product, partial [Ectocarpus sp. 13 AM-2016]